MNYVNVESVESVTVFGDYLVFRLKSGGRLWWRSE